MEVVPSSNTNINKVMNGVAFSDWESISDSAADDGDNKTSYTITSLTNGIPYSFKVLAVNVKDGVELYSDAASVNNTTPASKPDPPENLQATPSDASVELTWEAPDDDDGGSPITKYAYRRKYGRYRMGNLLDRYFR